MAGEYAIEMIDITKTFPGIKANDHITIQLKKGEIHDCFIWLVSAGRGRNQKRR